MTKLRLRIDFFPHGSLGPGKIRLLEEIRRTGSISAAARALDMSYRRAWLLIDALNHIFREPVLTAAVGGKRGGGSALTDFGEMLITQYHAIEQEAAAATTARMDLLQRALRPPEERSAESEAHAKEVAMQLGCAAARTRLAKTAK